MIRRLAGSICRVFSLRQFSALHSRAVFFQVGRIAIIHSIQITGGGCAEADIRLVAPVFQVVARGSCRAGKSWRLRNARSPGQEGSAGSGNRAGHRGRSLSGRGHPLQDIDRYMGGFEFLDEPEIQLHASGRLGCQADDQVDADIGKTGVPGQFHGLDAPGRRYGSFSGSAGRAPGTTGRRCSGG